MKINIKNVSTTNKRIRLIPRNGATAQLPSIQSNPTLSIINNRVSVCLSYESTDYAYISAPININFDIWLDNSWNRLYNTNSQDNDYEVIERLLENGIGIFKTFDSYGCFDLFRFQNMSNTEKRIRLSLEINDWNENGVNVLTPQENTSIIVPEPFQNNGYHNIEFTLAADKSFIPEQYINGFYPNHNIWFFQSNSQTSESYKYKFYVDGDIVNNPNGGTTFTLINQNDLNIATQALAQAGIRSNWYFYDSKVQTEFECLVTGEYKTLRVIQAATSIRQLPSEYIDYGHIVEGVVQIEKTPTNYTIDYYLYDPIDLEYEGPQ